MTLDLYGHLFPDRLEEVADRLDAAAHAVVYPLGDRADIIPVSVGCESTKPPGNRGFGGVAPTGFEPVLPP